MIAELLMLTGPRFSPRLVINRRRRRARLVWHDHVRAAERYLAERYGVTVGAQHRPRLDQHGDVKRWGNLVQSDPSKRPTLVAAGRGSAG
jgi:hypothetical protein